MPSNHLILCRPILLPPSIFPSIRVFSKESVLQVRWPKDWSFSFSISPSNEYSGLISFRMDWVDLLAVQGTLKSLLQCHSSKASILQCSAPSNTLHAALTGRVSLTRLEPSGGQRFSMSCFLLCSSHPAWHLGCRGHPLNVSCMNEPMTDSFHPCPRTFFGYSPGEQEDWEHHPSPYVGADATLTVLAVGALPATLALAVVAPIAQDTGALVHAWAGFAEVNWPLGFCKGGREDVSADPAWVSPVDPTPTQDKCEATRAGSYMSQWLCGPLNHRWAHGWAPASIQLACRQAAAFFKMGWAHSSAYYHYYGHRLLKRCRECS